MQLIIAEKNSVGMALAKALGVTEKKDGYMEGNGYIVSWADVELYVQDAVDSYFTELSSDWENNDNIIIRTSQIETRLLNCPGILDVNSTLQHPQYNGSCFGTGSV